MKKLIITVTLSLSLFLSTSNVNASNNNNNYKSLLHCSNVFYDKVVKSYCLSGINVDGEEFIIDIIQADKFNPKTLERLKIFKKSSITITIRRSRNDY